MFAILNLVIPVFVIIGIGYFAVARRILSQTAGGQRLGTIRFQYGLYRLSPAADPNWRESRNFLLTQRFGGKFAHSAALFDFRRLFRRKRRKALATD